MLEWEVFHAGAFLVSFACVFLCCEAPKALLVTGQIWGCPWCPQHIVHWPVQEGAGARFIPRAIPTGKLLLSKSRRVMSEGV